MGTPITGVDGDVYVSANPSISIGGTPEAVNNTDSGLWLAWKTATHRHWDKRKAITLQSSADGSTGWATVAATTYTWHPVGGTITFAVAPANHFLRISAGSYFNVTQLGDCSSWSLDMKANSVDTSVFGGDGWGSKTGTSKEVSGKVGSFRYDDRMTDELANLMVFVLYVDKSVGSRWECAGYLTGVTNKTSVDGVITQDYDFVGDGDARYYAST